LISALALGLSPLISACACKKPEPAAVSRPGEFMVFNPDRTGLPPFDTGRNDWPATAGQLQSPEEIVYEERIFDIQGRFTNQPDYTYRSFRSTRVGQARR